MRYPTAVKYEEPIRQMSDSRHHIGRTPVDYYRTAKEYDGQTTSLYDYYRTLEKVIQPHSSFIQPGISIQMVYGESLNWRPFILW